MKKSLLLVILSITSLASGNEYNHRNIITGGRAAALGGAFTAHANDPSGLIYNPAGIAFGSKNEVSLNTTAFYQRETKFKEVINGRDFNEISAATFPMSIGTIYSFANFAMGYVILTKEFQDYIQSDHFEGISTEENFANQYSRFLQESTNMQLYGVGMSYKFGKELSLGLSAFFYQRTKKLTIHQHAFFNTGAISNLDQSLSSISNGNKLVLGILKKWGQAFKIGMSVSAISEIADETQLSQGSLSYDPSESEPLVRSHETIEKVSGEDNLFAPEYRIGMAWKILSFWTFSADAIFHGFVRHQGNQSGVWDFQKVLNYSVGNEFVFDKVRVSLGVFTNYSAAGSILQNNVEQPYKVDYLGAAVEAGYNMKNFGISIGYVVQEGEGEAKKITGLSNVQEVASSSRAALLNMHYNL
mgnify:CR=1 FL=1